MNLKDVKNNELFINDKVVFLKVLWNSYSELEFGNVYEVTPTMVKVKDDNNNIYSFRKSKKYNESITAKVIKI